MCVLDGSSTLQEWMIWDHHPIRRNYEVVMDLGMDQLQCHLNNLS